MSIQEEIRRYLMSFVAGPNGDRGFMGIIGILRRDGAKLVTRTYELFCTELREKIQLASKDALVLLLGGVFLLVGLLAFVAASIIVLSFYIPLWLAAAVISLLFGFSGLVLVFSGIAAFRRSTITPQLTIQALRENIRWLRGHLE